MGCQGSKGAQVSKPEQQTTSPTLLQLSATDQKTVETERSVTTTGPAENVATEVAVVAVPSWSRLSVLVQPQNIAPEENPAEAVSTVTETDVANAVLSSAEKSGSFNWFKMLTFCTAEAQAEIVTQKDEAQAEISTQTDEPIFAQKDESQTEVTAQKDEVQTEAVAQKDEAQTQVVVKKDEAWGGGSWAHRPK